MKDRAIITIFVIAVLVSIMIIMRFKQQNTVTHIKVPPKVIKPLYDTIRVNITTYHVTKKQCGNDKGICENGYKITNNTYTDYYGTCGATIDLFKKFLDFNDTIQLYSDDMFYCQSFIVRDGCADSYKGRKLRNTIDVLEPSFITYQGHGKMIIKKK
jgi:hypothetical protein